MKIDVEVTCNHCGETGVIKVDLPVTDSNQLPSREELIGKAKKDYRNWFYDTNDKRLPSDVMADFFLANLPQQREITDKLIEEIMHTITINSNHTNYSGKHIHLSIWSDNLKKILTNHLLNQ